MKLSCIPRTLIRPGAAFLVAGILAALGSPQGVAVGDAPGSFFALSGEEAREFLLPADLRLARSFPLDAYGLTYERYEQFAGHAQVAGAEVTIHRDSSGAIVSVVGSHYPGITPANRVRQSASAAGAVAAQEFGPATSRNVELMIDPASGRYFHRVESRRFAERWVDWIDADHGGVLKSYDAIQHDHGTGVKGDTKTMLGPNGTANTSDDISTFHNYTGPPGGPGSHGASGPHGDLFSTDNRQLTYDARNGDGSSLYYVTDTNNHWDLVTGNRAYPGQPALVDAQYYADVSDRYYLTHGLDWVADCGYAAMQSVVHLESNYDNAFWEGTFVVYGDGNGTSTREFSGALDVVAHEHGHGVTQCTSNLDYLNQSGALNESFSDVMGSSAELFANEPLSSNCKLASGQTSCADWWVAEDVTLTADAKPGFRNMADPEEDFSNTLGAAHPDHFSEFIVTALDNGGVHVNSGIPNHAYFLLVNGGLNASCPSPGTHNAAHCSDGDTQDNNLNVTSIGLTAAEDIFFLGFTALPTNASFCQARASTEAAATTLFGAPSAQRRSTTDAWVAVGLTDAVCGIANTGPAASNGADYTLAATPKAVALAGSDAEQCELTFLVVNPPASGSLNSVGGAGCSAGAPSTDTASVTYTPNAEFSGTDSFTYRVNDGSWYSNVATITVSVFLNDTDDDNDGVFDTDENACGGAPINPVLRPERIDGPFASVDDDGDTAIDEALPGGAANFDCDGDGYKGSAESNVFSYLPQTNGDQKVCQEYDAAFPNAGAHVRPSKRWPADIASSAFSLNKVNLQDVSSFTNPVRYLNTDPAPNTAPLRFDLAPGSSFGFRINVADMATLTAGSTAFPPMLNGARAFNGPVCPNAP